MVSLTSPFLHETEVIAIYIPFEILVAGVKRQAPGGRGVPYERPGRFGLSRSISTEDSGFARARGGVRLRILQCPA